MENPRTKFNYLPVVVVTKSVNAPVEYPFINRATSDLLELGEIIQGLGSGRKDRIHGLLKSN